MEAVFVIDMIQRLVWLTLLLSAPLLVISLLVGVVISIFQAVTQIQESSLTFVPKILVSLILLVVISPWMIGLMVDYTQGIFKELNTIAKMRN